MVRCTDEKVNEVFKRAFKDTHSYDSMNPDQTFTIRLLGD